MELQTKKIYKLAILTIILVFQLIAVSVFGVLTQAWQCSTDPSKNWDHSCIDTTGVPRCISGYTQDCPGGIQEVTCGTIGNFIAGPCNITETTSPVRGLTCPAGTLWVEASSLCEGTQYNSAGDTYVNTPPTAGGDQTQAQLQTGTTKPVAEELGGGTVTSNTRYDGNIPSGGGAVPVSYNTQAAATDLATILSAVIPGGAKTAETCAAKCRLLVSAINGSCSPDISYLRSMPIAETGANAFEQTTCTFRNGSSDFEVVTSCSTDNALNTFTGTPPAGITCGGAAEAAEVALSAEDEANAITNCQTNCNQVLTSIRSSCDESTFRNSLVASVESGICRIHPSGEEDDGVSEECTHLRTDAQKTILVNHVKSSYAANLTCNISGSNSKPNQPTQILNKLASSLFSPVKVHAQSIPQAINPNQLDAGTYKITFTGYKTADVSIYNDQTQVKYFIDSNGDGIKQSTEEYIDTEQLEVKVNKETEIIKYTLSEGWNLINLPFVKESIKKASDLLRETAMQGVLPVQVSKYDNGNWIHFVARVTPDKKLQTYGTDFALIPGEAYFLRTLSAGELILQGNTFAEAVKINLVNGWNLKGINTNNKLTAISFLKECKVAEPQCKQISKFSNGAYQTIIESNNVYFGNDYNIKREEGYFILNNGEPFDLTP